MLRATRRMTYRDTEDQIRHYAPARYLCGLTESEWTPDANTIQDFEELLGEDGMRLLFKLIGGENPAGFGHVMVEPRLVMRDSTQARAGAARGDRRGWRRAGG